MRDPQFPERVRALLNARTPRPAHDPTARPSAVLMPLFWHEEEWHVLFTRRTETVAAHRGQIAFPGGRRDPEDASFLDTALRETEEEIGLQRAHVTVLGQLDEMLTIVTGYRIWPFVGVFTYPYEFILSAGEIAALIPLSLARLMDPAVCERQIRVAPDGRAFPVYFYHVDGNTVWGATAWMMHQFIELLEAV